MLKLHGLTAWSGMLDTRLLAISFRPSGSQQELYQSIGIFLNVPDKNPTLIYWFFGAVKCPSCGLILKSLGADFACLLPCYSKCFVIPPAFVWLSPRYFGVRGSIPNVHSIGNCLEKCWCPILCSLDRSTTLRFFGTWFPFWFPFTACHSPILPALSWNVNGIRSYDAFGVFELLGEPYKPPQCTANIDGAWLGFS